jgi:branched-chain amino acid transport system ATP-binding protein
MAAEHIELQVEHLSAGYAGTVAIEDISFRIAEGQRVGVLGRNGAGKTTTLAAIMGLAQCSGGSIRFGTADLARMPVFKRAQAGIGYVAQTRDVFVSLSVEENLVSGLQGRPKAGLEQAWTLFPRLWERRHHYGSQLSGGEQQMLAVARALMGAPRILLLDEPLEGVAPKVAEELMDAICRLADDTGVGCVLVEQHVDVVLDFAEEVLVLERGKQVFQGAVSALRAQPSVLERAIGLALHADSVADKE